MVWVSVCLTHLQTNSPLPPPSPQKSPTVPSASLRFSLSPHPSSPLCPPSNPECRQQLTGEVAHFEDNFRNEVQSQGRRRERKTQHVCGGVHQQIISIHPWHSQLKLMVQTKTHRTSSTTEIVTERRWNKTNLESLLYSNLHLRGCGLSSCCLWASSIALWYSFVGVVGGAMWPES